jgi:hypothetical protein
METPVEAATYMLQQKHRLEISNLQSDIKLLRKQLNEAAPPVEVERLRAQVAELLSLVSDLAQFQGTDFGDCGFDHLRPISEGCGWYDHHENCAVARARKCLSKFGAVA